MSHMILSCNMQATHVLRHFDKCCKFTRDARKMIQLRLCCECASHVRSEEKVNSNQVLQLFRFTSATFFALVAAMATPDIQFHIFFFLSFFLKFHDYVLWLVSPFSIRSIFSIHVLGTGTRKEQWKYISHKMWNSRRNRKQWSRPIVWSFERFQWMMMANRWLMKKYDSAQFHRHIRHIQYRTISRRNKDIQSGDMKAIKKFLNLLR